MKPTWLPGSNYIIVALVMLILCGVQTTLWYSLFGSLVSPPLWLVLIVYIALYRKLFNGLLFIYLLGMICTNFTAMPLKIMILTVFILSIIIHFVKKRIFWSGHGYFAIATTASTITYFIIYYFVSRAFEPNLITWNLSDRFLQIIMTPIFSIPIYKLLIKIDNWTLLTEQVETGGLEV